MFALGEGCADHFVCKWGGGGCAPPNPPLLKAIDACTKTSISSSPCGSFMFAVGEFCADPFVCKRGGAAPPFKDHRCLQQRTSVKSSPPSMLSLKNKHLVIAMLIIYVCTRGRLCGSFCLQMGGAAPPPTPPLFRGHRCFQLPYMFFIIFIVFVIFHYFHHLRYFASYSLFHSKISHWLPRYSAKKLGGKVENQPAQG